MSELPRLYKLYYQLKDAGLVAGSERIQKLIEKEYKENYERGKNEKKL